MSRPTAEEIEKKSAANRQAHLSAKNIGVQNIPRKVNLLDIGKPLKPVGRPKGRKVKVLVLNEHQEQVAVINWWRDYSTLHKLDERLLFAIPNASKLSDGGRIYKWAEGLRAGVPDLMLAVPKLFSTTVCTSGGKNYRYVSFCGLFIEMKRTKGSETYDEQTAYHTLLRSQGYQVEVCFGASSAIDAITAYLAN